MKRVKMLLELAILACFAITFAGCETYQNNENCGGIVKGYEYIGEKGEYNTYLQFEITFENRNDKFYPYIIVTESDFEFYSCNTIEELFGNNDYIKTYSNTFALESINNKAVLEINKEIILKSNISVYFYESVSNNSELIKIENLKNYIGYFKYESPLKGKEEPSPQEKGLIKLYGQSVEATELEVKNGILETATINVLYKIDTFDDNYVVNVTGLGGYENGTVTCLVALIVKDNSITKMKGVAVINWTNQIFIDKVTKQFLSSFSDRYVSGIYYSIDDGYVATGASQTSTAICNAVNGAIEYISKNLI